MERSERIKLGKRLGMPSFASHKGNADRRAILEDNKRMRDGVEGNPVNFGPGGGFGRVTLRIPEFDYPFIKAMFPELAAPDSETRHKGWQRFMRSPLSEPYRVEVKRRGNAVRPVIALPGQG